LSFQKNLVDALVKAEISNVLQQLDVLLVNWICQLVGLWLCSFLLVEWIPVLLASFDFKIIFFIFGVLENHFDLHLKFFHID